MAERTLKMGLIGVGSGGVQLVSPMEQDPRIELVAAADVNTASLAGLGPVPGYSVYAATKAATVSATMSVAAETPRRVRVHAICPDGVRTAMLDEQDPEGLGAALVHSGGRILSVEEIAEAAVGLVGSGRVVRTVPLWRGALMRTISLAPGVAAKGTALFAAQGRRALRRG